MPPCDDILNDKGERIGFACSRGGSRQKCGTCKTKTATRLCDFPLTGPKTGQTCSAPLCGGCSTRVGKVLDYCPAHARYTEER